MNEPVLDSSALLAVLLGEVGAGAVAAILPGALLSTVNFAEVVSKLVERGMPAGEAGVAIEATGVQTVDFDLDQARLAGELRGSTRSAGLSLGDRACLALTRTLGRRVLTADAAWAGLPGFDVAVIRNRPVA